MCQQTQFFQKFFFKYDDSVVCTLHLLCVFIYMVDKFGNFNTVQKHFLAKIEEFTICGNLLKKFVGISLEIWCESS